MRIVRKIVPHVIVVISIMLLVFVIIDGVNSAMGFINNAGTKTLIFIDAALGIFESFLFVYDRNKRKKERTRQTR